MMARRNLLREKLTAGEPTFGTRLHNQWPTITELVGLSQQFDYVEILAEYAPYDAFSLENVGRAIHLFDHMTGLVKLPQELRAHTAVRAISGGIQNVLFTDVRSAEDVRECIKMVKAESPETGGLRGVGQGRDVGIVLDVGSPEYVRSTADTVCAFMIEKKGAVEDLEAILDVPGVDMVQFGPADYLMGMGLAGQRDHPALKEAREYMISAALRKGVAPRAEIQGPDEAEYYLNLGVRHFCMGTDTRVLFNWYREQGTRLREVVGVQRVVGAGASSYAGA